jgi:hypothetical protein
MADVEWTRDVVRQLSECRSFTAQVVNDRAVLVINPCSGGIEPVYPEDGVWPREVLLARPTLDPGRTYRNRTPLTVASALVSTWRMDLLELARTDPDVFVADTGVNNPFHQVFKGGHHPAAVREGALDIVLQSTALSARPPAWSSRFPAMTRGDILLDVALEAVPVARRFAMLKAVLLAFAGSASALLRPFCRLNPLTGPENRGKGWRTVLEEAVQYLHKPPEEGEGYHFIWDYRDETDASRAAFLQAFLGKMASHRTGCELLDLFLGRNLTDMNPLVEAFEQDCLALTGCTPSELLVRIQARQALDVPVPGLVPEEPFL